MIRRRNVWLFVLCLALLLAAFGGYGLYRWQQFKQAQGIVALELRNFSLAQRGLGIGAIRLRRRDADGGELTAEIRGLSLALSSLTRPLPPRSLQIEHLDLELLPPSASRDEQAEAALPSAEQLRSWLAWLPERIGIDSLALSAPCAAGICRKQGSFALQTKRNPSSADDLQAQLHLQLERHPNQLGINATVRRDAAGIHLDSQLTANRQPRLSLQGSLEAAGETDRLSGSLALNGLPEAPWLLDWLGDWVAHQAPELPELPEQVRLGASWALRLPSGWLERRDWRIAVGELRLSAEAPTPWPLFDWGRLQGRLDLAAHAEAGSWAPSSLVADLELQPASELLAALPAPLRSERIRLQIEPGAAADASTLPLRVRATSDGPLRLTLDSQLQAATRPPLALHIAEARLQLQAARLDLAGWQLRTLAGDLRLSGDADQQSVRLAFAKGSQLSLARLGGVAQLTLDDLSVDPGGHTLAAAFTPEQPTTLSASGPLALRAGRLTHPSVRPQGWRWSGQAKFSSGTLTLDGALRNDADLQLTTQLRHDPAGALRIAATLPEIFLRAGNPLAATLADWPALLELTTGRLQAQGTLDLAPNGAPRAKANLVARSLGGIFDRTELSDLDARLALALERDRLRLDVDEASLQQANSGLVFGPLRFRGDYQADLARLGDGRLAWQTAETQVLGGRFWLEPGALVLDGSEQSFSAHLRGLQLPLLLQAYPSEGLAGTGVIDGDLRLRHGPQGFSVDQGNLAARPPGGALQFRSPQIQALGQSNPAMRLVTEALDDFHYDLLTSDVRYASDGTLLLGLRLHGRNPALEGGRPINFSINLEEDIPALLTSLQLSDRVSETIQRRVQERLR